MASYRPALTFDASPKPWARQMLTMSERFVDYSKPDFKDPINQKYRYGKLHMDIGGSGWETRFSWITFTWTSFESISISFRFHSTSVARPIFPFHFDSSFDVFAILRARNLTSPKNNNNTQEHDEMMPIAKMLWCLPLPSRTLSHSHVLSTWKFRNVSIFEFFRNKGHNC